MQLFEMLKNPVYYPHKPKQIIVKETHASIVFIAKPYVYKFKKNVNFGFLDFSSLEKRFYYCIEEIRLNQRLCKEIYINLIKIYYKDNLLFFEDIFLDEEFLLNKKYKDLYNNIIKNINNEVEFGVKMHYIEEAYFLKNQQISISKLEKVAEVLAKFYQTQKPIQEDYSRKNIEENLNDCKDFISYTISPLMYRFIKKFNQTYFKKYHFKLKKRVENGWIKDCHGDLHLEHIVVKDDSICIYDCIEFNQEFRCIDIANDLAFLCMDLEFYGYYRESYYFIKYFYKKFYNYALIFLQDLYRSYRAFVRGKVYSIKSRQDKSEEEKQKSVQLAEKYFRLSLKYALFDIHPSIVVFMGRIGSGKSTLARKFSEFFGINQYSSDAIRKSFFRIPLYDRTPEELKSIVYSKIITDLVYNKMIESAIQDSLKMGISVVDGVFGSRYLRNIALFRAFEENVKIIFVEIETKKEIILKRLEKRMNSKEISDAGINEFLSFYDYYEPPYEIPLNQKIHLKIVKEREIDQIFHYLLKKILIHRFLFKHPY